MNKKHKCINKLPASCNSTFLLILICVVYNFVLNIRYTTVRHLRKCSNVYEIIIAREYFGRKKIVKRKDRNSGEQQNRDVNCTMDPTTQYNCHHSFVNKSPQLTTVRLLIFITLITLTESLFFEIATKKILLPLNTSAYYIGQMFCKQKRYVVWYLYL